MKYRCQSALNLLELNRRFHVFAQGSCHTVLDLAAAPGGFAQVALQQMRASHRRRGDSCMTSAGVSNAHARCGTSNKTEYNATHSRDKHCDADPAHHSVSRSSRPVNRLLSSAGAPTTTKRSDDNVVIAVDLRPIAPMPGLVALRCNVLDHARVMQQTSEVLSHLSHRSARLQSKSDPSRLYASLCDSDTHASHESSHRDSHSRCDALGGDDFFHPSMQAGPRGVDVVLHDGVSVIRDQYSFSVTYAQNQMALSALQLACKIFARFGSAEAQPCSAHGQLACRDARTGGVFLTKVLQSVHLDRVLQATRCFFDEVHVHKPRASRADSLEKYVIAKGFLPHRWHRYIRHGAWYSVHSVTRQTRLGAHVVDRSNAPTMACADRHVSVFCMPPSPADTPRGRLLVWRCLGCDQPRIGCAPCPACSSLN